MDIGARATTSTTRKWLAVSLSSFAIAALAGCASGHPAGNTAGSAKPEAIRPSSSATAGHSPASAQAGIAGGGAQCVTPAAKANCGPYNYPLIQGASQNPTVGNDVWAPISGWKQTLYADNPGNWRVSANMPAGNTAVVSYPSIGALYGDRRLSHFSGMYSSFTETMHARKSTSAWAAYDIWLNNYNNEVMIQHDFANNGPCGAVASATFGGSGGVPVQRWNLCQFGSELIWKLAGRSEHSGRVNILAMLSWLEGHRFLPRSSSLTLIGYGWEICSTGGRPESFQVSRFSISAS